MDYKELSKVHDAVTKGVAPVSVSGKKVVDEKNPLDALASSPEHIEDKSVVKYIILDSVQINKLRSMTASQRKRFLGKLTDSQRRHVLDEMTRLKEQESQVKDSGFSVKLAYTLLDQQLANFLYEPSKPNRENLEQVYDQYKDVWDDNTVAFYTSVLNNGKFVDTDENVKLLEGFLSNIDGESQVSLILSVLSESQEEAPEMSEEEEQAIVNQAESDAQLAFDSAEFDITAAVQAAIDKFVSDSVTYPQVYCTYLKSWATKMRDHALAKLSDSKIVDEKVAQALDKLNELPYIDEDGKPKQDKDEVTILELVSQAIEEFAEGDDAKLQEIAKQTVEVKDPAVESQVDEAQKDEEPAEDEEFKDSANAIALAKSILSGKPDNAIIDSMKDKVPALKKYNFRVSDCDVNWEQVEEPQAPVNMPLTREEYCALCPPQTPDYFDNLIKSVSSGQCPYINEYNCPEGMPYLVVNGCQKYYPYGCTVEELKEQLASQPQTEWHRIVSSQCCPLEDAFHLAAMTNNLSFIDNAFYKKHLNDSEWAFDTIPACLADVVTGPGLIRMKKKNDSSDKVVTIYGQEFVVL